MSAISVLLDSRRAGTLTLHGDSWAFTYDQRYSSRPDATAISLSIPITNSPIRGTKVRNFFQGLLPPTQVQRHWANTLQLKQLSAVSLLEHVGGDLLGSIQTCSEGDSTSLILANPATRLAPKSLCLSLGTTLRLEDSAWTPLRPEWAAPGERPKVPGCLIDARWYLPDRGTPSTHFLRSGTSLKSLGEFLLLKTAATLGISAVDGTLLPWEGGAVLAMERFDRYDNGISTSRVHAESLLQALGANPNTPFPREGGPTLKDLSALVKDHVVLAKVNTDLERLGEILIFSFLCGCENLHSHNIHFLEIQEKARLAPLCHAAPKLFSPDADPFDRNCAFPLLGEYRAARFDSSHWNYLAKELGLDRDWIKAKVIEFATAIPTILEDTLPLLRPIPNLKDLEIALIRPITKVCEKIAKGLLGPAFSTYGIPENITAEARKATSLETAQDTSSHGGTPLSTPPSSQPGQETTPISKPFSPPTKLPRSLTSRAAKTVHLPKPKGIGLGEDKTAEEMEAARISAMTALMMADADRKDGFT